MQKNIRVEKRQKKMSMTGYKSIPMPCVMRLNEIKMNQ